MEQGKHEKTKPRFIALRALGRSRVITATPFGWTLPLTNSSAAAAAAIVAKPRKEDDVLPKWRYWEWDLGPRKRKRVEDRFKSWDALTRLRMFLSAWEQEIVRGDGELPILVVHFAPSLPTNLPSHQIVQLHFYLIYLFILDNCVLDLIGSKN